MSLFFILTLIFTIFIVLIIIFYMKRSRTIFSVSQVNKNIFKHQFYEINEDFLYFRPLKFSIDPSGVKQG